MIRRITLLLSLVLLSVSPVNASEINDDGAKRLKKLFSSLLNEQKESITTSGGRLETKGDITIEKARDYYAVTLPEITLHDVDGMKGKIGLIAINATPTDNPDNWKMSIAIPTPILYSDESGDQTVRLDIGSQKMGGLWNGKLNNFSKLAGQYDDIKLSHYKKQETLTIKRLTIATDLKETENNQWSGPTKINLSNIHIGTPKSTNLATLKEAKIKLNIDGYTPEKAVQNTEEDTSQTFGLLKKSGDSFLLQGLINDLKINTPTLTALSPKHFSLKSGSFEFGAHDMKQDKMSQTLKIKYDGFQFPDDKNHYKEIFPNKFKAEIKLENLPLPKISGIVENILTGDKNNSGARQVAALQAMITLPQILSEAGTTLTITNTAFGNEFYNTKIDGNLIANTQSIIGTTGTLNAEIQGFDDVIKKLEARNDAEKNKTQKRISYLKLLQDISKKDGNKYICNAVLNEKAQLSINGKDMSELFDVSTKK